VWQVMFQSWKNQGIICPVGRSGPITALITAINRAIITKTQTSSLADQNTVSHHTQGAPTLHAITEAKTFTVSAVQRYDSYGGQNYLNIQMKMIHGQRYFMKISGRRLLMVVLKMGF